MTPREEIFDLTVRYASAIDGQRYDVLTEVFTDDAVIDYGGAGSGRVAPRSRTSWSGLTRLPPTPCIG